AGVRALTHRGPDAQGIVRIGKLLLGHTRLSIIDPDPRSNQPFTYGGVTLVYDGELWNYVALREQLKRLGCKFKTSGDTEVLAAALNQWGTAALTKLDGMFALAWTTEGKTLYLARDRFGEMPLHVARQKPFAFASELKGLLALGANRESFEDLPPGHYLEVTASGMRTLEYYDPPAKPRAVTRAEASARVFKLLEAGTSERTISDVPVCTLLS